ncbi:hypothetical protein [Microcystis sp.]|uniref:hypothetical protein n=1 Tax=Microcystis sp. TaxID=1127 RepID=UPI003AF85B0F
MGYPPNVHPFFDNLLSVISYQLSVISYQLSVISYQLSVINSIIVDDRWCVRTKSGCCQNFS